MREATSTETLAATLPYSPLSPCPLSLELLSSSAESESEADHVASVAASALVASFDGGPRLQSIARDG